MHATHQHKRREERARIPAVFNDVGWKWACTGTVGIAPTTEPADVAAAVAEQRHPEVLECVRRHLIEQFRVAENSIDVDALLAIG